MTAASLVLELYWLEAFTLMEWQHLAAMVVSTALLGLGAGSVAVLLLSERQARAAARRADLLAMLACVAIAVGPGLVRAIRFEPLLLIWQASAWLALIAREAAVALPFTILSALATLVFRSYPQRSAAVYGATLTGASSGCLLTLALLSAGAPGTWIHRLAATGACAATLALGGARGGRHRAGRASSLAALAALLWTLFNHTGAPRPSPFKDLPQALRLPGAKTIAEKHGVHGAWTLVEAPALRSAPGLSLQATAAAPPAAGIFIRAAEAGLLPPLAERRFLRERVTWLPYALRQPQSVLLPGGAASLELAAAVEAGAARLLASASDSRTAGAVERHIAAAHADLGATRVDIRRRSARALIAGATSCDLIVLPAEDSLASAGGGFLSGTENYIYTEEAIAGTWRGLPRAGQLALTRWVQMPPRDMPRLVRTVAETLRRSGIPEPARHIILVRNWDAWTLAASPQPYQPAELARADRFCAALGFDRLWPPPQDGRPATHSFPDDPTAALLAALLLPEAGVGSRLIEEYPYRTAPARDDAPYFHAFLRLNHIRDYWGALRDNAQSFAEWGELIVAATLVSALVLGTIGILLPACLHPQARAVVRRSVRPSAYFLGLGLAYLMIEIVWIQQGALLTSEPTLTAMVVISAFLAGSGAGALSLARARTPPRLHPALVVCALALLAAAMLPPTSQRLLHAPPGWGWACIAGTALLLGFAMGRPLPVGLDRFARDNPPLLCWCLALNAWASVVAPLAATILAATAGFRTVLGIAALIYLGCALTSRRASIPRTG